jgi:hypothetical protein
MRRKRAFKRSRVVPILVAGFAGYVLGGLSTPSARNPNVTAAQAVADRFPQDWGDTSPATTATMGPRTADAAQFALLSPVPMVPQASVAQAPVLQAAAADTPNSQPAMQMAALEQPAAMPASVPAQASAPKPIGAAVHRRSDRPGYMLNDAQIASIKDRLHLTPDQAEMWPAVEAALRNIASAKVRDAHRHGAPALQEASADPDSTDVQNLKSAAIPLLMSFNSEQKDEVRNLAHVMGLDQLATQF